MFRKNKLKREEHFNSEEKKLAIEMWEQVKASYGTHLVTVKRRFVKEHNLDWFGNCWLCALFHDEDTCCKNCPLDYCDASGSTYKKLFYAKCNEEDWKKNCDIVIAAIKDVEVMEEK